MEQFDIFWNLIHSMTLTSEGHDKLCLVNGCGGTVQRQTTFGGELSRSSMGIFGVGGVQKK